MGQKTANLYGCHFGGDQYATFWEELARQRNECPFVLPPLLEFQCTDLVATRANNIARRLNTLGISATSVQEDANRIDIASQTSKTVLIIGATDDTKLQHRFVERSNAAMTAAGILLAAPGGDGIGNGIIAFGCTFVDDRQDALELFQRLALWTGGQRSHSKDVAAPLFNEQIFAPLRRALYREIGLRTLSFLNEGSLASGLMVATATMKRSVPLILEYRDGRNRSRMMNLSERTRTAIAFIDAENPKWMFLAIPTAIGMCVYELPTPPEPDTQQIRGANVDTSGNLSRHKTPTLYATD